MTLAATHWNRYDMLTEMLALPMKDARISEIVVCDDASDDGSWAKLLENYGSEPKIRLRRNPERLDCYQNKATAIAWASNEWTILFDSDNILDAAYIDAIPRNRSPEIAYLPTFARPDFDYRAFAGAVVTQHNVATYCDEPMFLTALNTANYLVHRDTYLEVHNPHAQPGTADSIYMNLRWLLAGGALQFVDGMTYQHRIHDGSHFMTNNTRQHDAFKQQIIHTLRTMR